MHHCLHRSLHLRLEAVQAKNEGMKHKEKLFSMFHPAYIHSRKAPPTPMKPLFFATRTVYLCSRLHKYAKQGATVAEKDGEKHKRKDSLPQVPVFSKKPFTFSKKACVFFAELPPKKLHIYAYCRAQVPPPAPRPSVRVRRFPRRTHPVQSAVQQAVQAVVQDNCLKISCRCKRCKQVHRTHRTTRFRPSSMYTPRSGTPLRRRPCRS